jgi:hypothetical protein
MSEISNLEELPRRVREDIAEMNIRANSTAYPLIEGFEPDRLEFAYLPSLTARDVTGEGAGPHERGFATVEFELLRRTGPNMARWGFRRIIDVEAVL